VTRSVYLGVDIGTSGCRALAVDSDGHILASATRSYSLSTPAPGYVEQDAGEWIDAAFATLAELCSGGAFDPHDVRGVGVDGQSWSAIPVDETDQVLAPTPNWMDTRAQPICDEILGSVGPSEILRLAGNRLSPSYATAKIVWFARHRPEVYERTRWFLASNSVIVLALTGRATLDHSQGYGLHCIDVATGEVDLAMARRLGIDPERIPPAYESTAVVGEVTESASRRTGILAGTPVVAGGLDAACGTLGTGAYLPGQTQEQGCQAGGMSIVVDAPVADERLILSRHVVPGAWLLQGGTVAGSASLAWLTRVVGEAERVAAEAVGSDVYEEVSAAAGSVAPGSGGLVFLPYLVGERSPLWDADARGAFLGLTLATDRGALYRAVMEGVAMSLRHNLDVAYEAGASVAELLAIGGATKSPVWMQIKADVTGLPVTVSDNDAATPLGAAMLAVLGTGGGDVDELVDRWVRRAVTYQPDPETASVYERLYRVYRGLYGALAPSMHELAAIGRRMERPQ
jgi:xylulokinase